MGLSGDLMVNVLVSFSTIIILKLGYFVLIKLKNKWYGGGLLVTYE